MFNSNALMGLAQSMYKPQGNPSGLGFTQDSPSPFRGQGELNQWGQPKQGWQDGSQREVLGQEGNPAIEKYLRKTALEQTGDSNQWRDFLGWDATEDNPGEDMLYNPDTPWQGFDSSFKGPGGSPNVGMRGLGSQAGQLLSKAMGMFGG